jgi:hypothetical protein
MRTAILAAAVLGLAACQPATPEKAAAPPGDGETTGAAGATTSAADPNPTGAGAVTDATPGDPSGAMASTPPTLPEPEASNMPTPADPRR